ncbi:Bromodomain containing protein [Echinococcus multilocularis]|uniref:Bromodomain containing protein n=1 Tax=Echinococcus multilocularis TaxID=6211 RepID=A0A068Y510_ECHMU|nr:Bromodomain containing protein [Echinococcus multilocularis]
MSFSENRAFRSEHSSGSLRFKISLSKQEMEHEEPESSPSDPPYRTSYSLYVVLSEIHRLCVKRDHKGIFANPVTEDIAPDYFSIISHPMDLGTMYSRLESRSYYSTASQYLADVRLMCQNAMCYNPPDTIYYQKARKLLAFVEKQMTPHSLRKLSTELLKMSRPLTDEEIGGEFVEHHHRHQQQQHVHPRRQDSQNQHFAQTSTSTAPYSTSTGSIFTPPKLQEEEIEEVEVLEDEEERERAATESSSSPILSVRKRRPSSASISSVSKLPRYASSPPLLVPEVEDSVGRVDSPLTQSTCGRNDSDVVTIDLETTEIDLAEASLTLSPASSTISSSTLRGGSRKCKRRGVTQNTSAPTPPPRPPGPSRPRRKNGGRLSASPLPYRVHSEDTWTFPDCITDRSSPGQVVAQAKHAARAARDKFLARYGRQGHQTIVYLDTTEPGKIYAKPCGDCAWIQDEEEGESEKDQRKLVDYPLALRQLLTPKPQSTGQGVYHGLVEQMTSQQVATLHALSKLRYDSTEPVGMGIHGPLAIFEKDELAQLCDAYGGDVMAMESVLSLLTFVEPLGEWARRWAHRRLDNATDGYHGKMLLAFTDPTSEFYANNWMRRAGLTIDPNVVEEFKAESTEKEELSKGAESSQASVDPSENCPTSSVAGDFQPLEVESTGSGHMSMAKMPSNTSTTDTTVKQMATVQPLQRLVSPSCNSSDDKSVTSNTLETSTMEADKESEDEEEVEEGNEEEEEEGETFDILSAALDASVTPAVPEQMPQQQPQQQQYVLTTYCVMDSGATSAVLEAPGNPTLVVNPLAASVNDIAQISALTAAISPIQPLSTLPSTCIGLPKPLPASITSEGGCSSSTLLVVHRKMGEEDATLDESLPMEMDLEPDSEESPKNSASEGSLSKGSVEEEEATGDESEGSIIEVSAELSSKGSFKESPPHAPVLTETSSNSAPSKVPFKAANLSKPPENETRASITGEPEFSVVEEFSEASEGNVSPKLDVNEVEESSSNSTPSKESPPQEPASVQPSDNSASSEMAVQSPVDSRDSIADMLDDPQRPLSTGTYALGVKEPELTPIEESAEPLSQMGVDRSPILMRPLQDSAIGVDSTFSDETLEDLQRSCRTGLNAPVVKAPDFSIIQQSSEPSVQEASEKMNLDEIEKSILGGSPLEASASLKPFQNPVASDMDMEFCAIEGSSSFSENVEEVPRGSVPEMDDQIVNKLEFAIIEESSEALSKADPGGGATPSKETESCAAEVYPDSSDEALEEPQKSPRTEMNVAAVEELEFARVVESSEVTDVDRGSLNEVSKEGPLQASDSMESRAVGVIPHSSDDACQRASLEAPSNSNELLERALVQALEKSPLPFSIILPQRIETGVKSSEKRPLPTSEDVESSVDFAEPGLTRGSLNSAPSSSDVSLSSETHFSVELLREEAMDVRASSKRKLPLDESNRFVSNGGSPSEVRKLVDYEIAESSENEATDHPMVEDSPVDAPILLESPNYPTAGVETSPHAAEVQEAFDGPIAEESGCSSSASSNDSIGLKVASSRMEDQVQMEMEDTLQSYPCQYEVNEAEFASFISGEEEEMHTEFRTPPPHSQLVGGGLDRNDDPTPTSNRSSPKSTE